MIGRHACGIAVLALALLVPAVVAAADIKTTIDPAADLTKYQTFTFFEPAAGDKGAITDGAARERLRYMIARHLNGRGYKPAPPGKTGDLGVYFSGQAVPKRSVLMVGRAGPYDYGWGNQELGGTDTMDYREGTVVIDLVDVSKGQLVWRARIIEALTAGYSEENWKKAERAVGDAFKKLPARK